jgi:glutaredoxin
MTRVLRCAGCGRVAETSWLTVTIEASPGQRERPDGSPYWSTRRTTVRGQPLCPSCVFSPEWAWLLKILGSESAQPAPNTGSSCVIICTHRAPVWWRRLFPASLVTWPGTGRAPCPSCHRPANIWGAKSPPIAVTDLADRAITKRRNLAQWVRYMSAEIYYGPDQEADPELEIDEAQAIETAREGP